MKYPDPARVLQIYHNIFFPTAAKLRRELLRSCFLVKFLRKFFATQFLSTVSSPVVNHHNARLISESRHLKLFGSEKTPFWATGGSIQTKLQRHTIKFTALDDRLWRTQSELHF